MIYLDHHATTPIDPEVLDAMMPYFTSNFANPSSEHVFGASVNDDVERARGQVASLIGANPEQIYFTSGATESNNIAIAGRVKCIGNGASILTTPVEHSSVLSTVSALKNEGKVSSINYLGVDDCANINIDELEKTLKHNRIDVVSVMSANNEVGTIYPIKDIGGLCKMHGVYFHTDSAQALAYTDVDVGKMNVDALSISGHKIYGPKGVGALYLRSPGLVCPLIHGGYQNVVTSGTINAPGIIGLGKACEMTNELLSKDKAHVSMINSKFLKLLEQGIGKENIVLNGNYFSSSRLPNNLNISIKNVPAEAIISGLDDVMVSGGSACNSGNHKPSHVLLAMGSEYADNAIRFGFGRCTTEEDIECAAKIIIDAVNAII